MNALIAGSIIAILLLLITAILAVVGFHLLLLGTVIAGLKNNS